MLDYVFGIAGALVPFLVAFAILVTVHEYGHFIAGKALGTRPTHFAVGLGKVLWSRQDRDGCEWQLRAIPIGGFVRFLGDRDGTGMVSATDMPDNAKPDPKSPYLLRRPPLHRAIVLAAGPGANLLLGFLVIASLYVGFGRPVVPPCPSSDDLRLFRRLRNGGSGSSGFEVMRPAAGAASVCA